MTEATPEQEAFSRLYGYIDSSGGLHNSLANAIQAADEEGFHVESIEDKAASVDACLDEAMSEMDSLNPDADEVEDLVSSANSALWDMTRMTGGELDNWELPDHVDSGIYDTFGDFLDYVYRDSLSMTERAEEWAHHRQD